VAVPQHVVCPMAERQPDRQDSQGVGELEKDRPRRQRDVRDARAQAAGCNPIADMVKNNRTRRRCAGRTRRQVAGDRRPADGYFAAQLIRSYGRLAEDATTRDPEAMVLLAKRRHLRRDGGGVTVAVARS